MESLNVGERRCLLAVLHMVPAEGYIAQGAIRDGPQIERRVLPGLRLLEDNILKNQMATILPGMVP